MKTILTITGIVLLFYGAFVELKASIVYIIWLFAFIGLYVGWTFFFSLTSIVSAVAFHYTDLASAVPFHSTALPWISGVAAFIVFVGLLVRYSNGGHNNHYHGTDAGGWDGGCDGGGGD